MPRTSYGEEHPELGELKAIQYWLEYLVYAGTARLNFKKKTESRP